MLATLLLSLRGTPFIYQGQEIGMTNFDFTSMEQVQDVESHSIWRDGKKASHPGGLPLAHDQDANRAITRARRCSGTKAKTAASRRA